MIFSSIINSAFLLYLPRYSPDFNPIELCWSKIKSYLKKKKAQDYKLLETYIKEALDTITIENAKGWFSHCGYFVT